MWNFRKNRIKRGTLLTALVFVLVCLILALALRFAEARRPQIVAYPSGYQMPANQGPLLERLIPRKWDWAWRLRDKIRGKVKEVFIQGAGLQIKESPDQTAATLGIGPPTFNDGSNVVWLLEKTAPDSLLKQFHNLNGATEFFEGRISTGESVEADMSIGDRVVTASGLAHAGTTLQTFPRLRTGKIDLATVFTWTEAVTNSSAAGAQAQTPAISVRTNAAVATRIQLPFNAWALILTRDESRSNSYIALLLSAKQQH